MTICWPQNINPFPEAERLVEAVNRGERFIFLSGRAGTGKSTAIRTLLMNLQRDAVVLGSTGLAASALEGQTVHYFFGLKGTIQTPDIIANLRPPRRVANAELIILDEISMCRSDLMHAVDVALRRAKGNDEPFGRVQIIVCGDMGQLEPVASRENRAILDKLPYIDGYFWHQCKVFRSGFVGRSLELQTVRRVNDDAEFVEALSGMRIDQMRKRHAELINSRVGTMADDALILTAQTKNAKLYNDAGLKALGCDLQSFHAQKRGEIPKAPADDPLRLAVGAKVLITSNGEGYANGDTGKVREINDDSILVEVRGVLRTIRRRSWTFDALHAMEVDTEDEARRLRVERNEAGWFEQFPLKLAWAVTIHKSQGMSIAAAHLDLGKGAFGHGQTYVGCSRTTTRAGLTLARPIIRKDVAHFKPEALIQWPQL